MGTIADKLNKALANKADIKAALIEKGRTPSDNMSTYGDEIRAIETGGGGVSSYNDLQDKPIVPVEELPPPIEVFNKKEIYKKQNDLLKYVGMQYNPDGYIPEPYVVRSEKWVYLDEGEVHIYYRNSEDKRFVIPIGYNKPVKITLKADGVTYQLIAYPEEQSEEIIAYEAIPDFEQENPFVGHIIFANNLNITLEGDLEPVPMYGGSAFIIMAGVGYTNIEILGMDAVDSFSPFATLEDVRPVAIEKLDEKPDSSFFVANPRKTYQADGKFFKLKEETDFFSDEQVSWQDATEPNKMYTNTAINKPLVELPVHDSDFVLDGFLPDGTYFTRTAIMYLDGESKPFLHTSHAIGNVVSIEIREDSEYDGTRFVPSKGNVGILVEYDGDKPERLIIGKLYAWDSVEMFMLPKKEYEKLKFTNNASRYVVKTLQTEHWVGNEYSIPYNFSGQTFLVKVNPYFEFGNEQGNDINFDRFTNANIRVKNFDWSGIKLYAENIPTDDITVILEVIRDYE